MVRDVNEDRLKDSVARFLLLYKISLYSLTIDTERLQQLYNELSCTDGDQNTKFCITKYDGDNLFMYGECKRA